MYKNRTEAGALLAGILAQQDIDNPCLLAIPRGGIVVAAPIASKLNTPINLLATRKVGHPRCPEVAIGAVMPDGSAVWDKELIESIDINEEDLCKMAADEYVEIKRRMIKYGGSDKSPQVKDKTVIIVDDGIATGYTVRAAITWLKPYTPHKIIIAVPVGPPLTIKELRQQVDDVLCPMQPVHFSAVGMFYQDFTQAEDKTVLDILTGQN